MSWAWSSQSALIQHDDMGGVTLNVASGGAVAATDNLLQQRIRMVIVHAALMLLAFVVLMPAGVMLARHKWMFGGPKVGL